MERREREVVILEEGTEVEDVKDREVVFVEDWKCQGGLGKKAKFGAVPKHNKDGVSRYGGNERKVLLGAGPVQKELRRFPQGRGNIERVRDYFVHFNGV